MSYTKVPFAVYILILLFLAAGCESPPGVTDPTRPTPNLQDVTVQPDSISFRHINASYDTTVTVKISAVISSENAEEPSFAIKTSNDSTISRGSLQPGDSADVYNTSVDLLLNTATFATYYTYIYTTSPSSDGSWIQAKINIFGLSGSPPNILAVNNPDTVQKPSGDSVRNVPFQAKVADPDGQENIQLVAFELIDQNNPNDVVTIELFDNGSSNSGDPMAGDSVYTQVLSVDSENTSTTYDILYFARDKADLVSDTVKTTFTITD